MGGDSGIGRFIGGICGDRIRDILDDHALEVGIIRIGGDSGIDDFDLDLLYKQSKLYIFPSLYEGFGLPPLEAIARGLPVVSSSSSCLPEVLGEGALYFDPNNIENIADTINEGLYNEDIRHQLLINGRTELQKYSSEKMAIDTLEIYKKNCG